MSDRSADRTPPAAAARSLPVGTVTFLRTDVEGSMRLMRALGPAWDAVNAEHLAIIAKQVEAHDGVIVRTEGDALFAAFPEAGAAVAAAVAAQRALAAHPWPPEGPVVVRMGLHSGEAHIAGDDYGGFDVNRAARIAAVGHGGQIILSGTAAALVADDLPDGVTLLDLGRHRLRDVPRPERISQLVIRGFRSEFPPLTTGAAPNGNLPERRTSFVGREQALESALALVRTSRLVTLIGPGGIGKSSLAVEVARVLAHDVRDGAWFVDLTENFDPSQVTAAIARTLGLHDGTERTAADALPGFLSDRETVIVLDNFEHVLAAASAVGDLLAASVGTRFIATSRAPLHLRGEQEFPVEPLPVGGTDAGARQLFVERVHSSRPGWAPSDADEPTIDDICARLDGLPLGIELAAARVGVLPISVIRDRLAARLPLPGSGPRDAPERQRTLEGAVAWSHDLLDPTLQVMFRSLAVFEGGFDLEQVEAVASVNGVDALDGLMRLADQSLIEPDTGVDDRIRFSLLETIGSFALDRLRAAGEEDAARKRHAEAYLTLVEATAPRMSTSAQPLVMDRLEPETANLWSALRWAIDHGAAEIAQRILAATWRYWNASGQLAAASSLARETLAMPAGQDRTRYRMWATAAAGSIAYWQADPQLAHDRYREELELAEEFADDAGQADAIYNLGYVAFIEGLDDEQVVRLSEDALARYRALGDERMLARAYWSNGVMALQAGRLDESQVQLTTGLRAFEAFDDPQYHAMALSTLGWGAFLRGDLDSAIRWSVESILESYALRDVATTTISLHIGVLLAVVAGRPEDAVRLSGAFDALTERYGVRPPAELSRFISQMDPFAIARAALPPDRMTELDAEGRTMGLDEAVALVAEIGAAAREAGGIQFNPPGATGDGQ